jgi:hypothetical protein
MFLFRRRASEATDTTTGLTALSIAEIPMPGEARLAREVALDVVDAGLQGVWFSVDARRGWQSRYQVCDSESENGEGCEFHAMGRCYHCESSLNGLRWGISP